LCRFGYRTLDSLKLFVIDRLREDLNCLGVNGNKVSPFSLHKLNVTLKIRQPMRLDNLLGVIASES
jgi:hypothetical protein